MGEFRYESHRIEYDSYGEGDRVIILVHGLLMNRQMFERLGPALADRGNRAICVDLLGHGRSDRPEDLRLYTMPLFARQLAGLIEHLGLGSAVVGGTSLGANVALELATRDPDRVKGLFIEMPVLDHALPAVAATFAPILLGLQVGRPVFEVLSRVASNLPRTNHLIDVGLDWVRQRPGPSLAVLQGLLLGETAPHQEQRQKISQPALIVGHPRDPLHPFSDSGMLSEELANGRLLEASSILEWRLNPDRLNAELAIFLEEVWTPPRPRPTKGQRARKKQKQTRGTSKRAGADKGR
jgi:pimeloyl-ACP methyl ester carboxylesterase